MLCMELKLTLVVEKTLAEDDNQCITSIRSDKGLNRRK